MIVCQQCEHENYVGAVFCDECGLRLGSLNTMVTQAIHTTDRLKIAGEGSRVAVYDKTLDTWASLNLLDSGQILPLTERMDFTLGRVSDDQPIMPDIDLTPYQAYASGVSRLHAVLKREGKRVLAQDLGSANGTYLNGKRLKPNTGAVLKHGDVLSLGKLKIQILLRDH